MVIDHYNLRPVRKHFAQRLYLIFSFRHDGNIRGIVKQPPHALTQPCNVVGHNAPNLLLIAILCDGTHRSSFQARGD